MTPRQKRALLRPLSRATGDPRAMDPYRDVRRHRTGLLMMTILAVDR